ncbi:MAG: HD domain-containing protein [Pirellula sp.]|jgi:HD-GYP domain-containing protein (c-di-GMP phosphodiesterase class II)|nr:HD domain-containing protein [Pirellula sp.]
MTSPTLHGIHPATILPNSVTGFNIYLSNREEERPIKFLANNQLVDEAECGQLRSQQGLQVFIEETSRESYREYLSTHSSQWMNDPGIPASMKTELLLECMLAKWQVGFQSTDWDRVVALSREISEQLTDAIERIGIQIPHVLEHLDAGTNPTVHALRTGIYCALLSKELGFDRPTMIELCMGGMLHDVGKRSMGDEAELASHVNERSTRAHPLIGFRRLCRCADLPMTSLLMCYQHHENFDGSGFPVQLVDQEIHVGARICAIANRFDHLTSNENPRMAYAPGSAGRILEQDKSNRFDPEIMKAWLKLLKTHLRNS